MRPTPFKNRPNGKIASNLVTWLISRVPPGIVQVLDDGIARLAQVPDSSLIGDVGEEVVDPAVGRVADAGVAAVHERGTLGQDGERLGDGVHF